MTSTSTTDAMHWDAEIGAFRITGYDEAAAVLRGEGWSSDLRLSPLVNEELKDFPGGSMLSADGSEHSRLRRPISPAFTQKAIESLRPRVAAIVDSVLDGLSEVGPQFDVLADVGYPVALAVITELLDVGNDGAQLFAELTPALARGIEFDASLDDLMAAAAASTEMMLFLTPIIAERRSNRGEDFISSLLALEGDQPDELSLGEIMTMCTILLIAGHETTANLIANSTLALLQDPGQIPALLADPARAVEELLRCHGPVKLLTRTALTDHEIAGHRIPAGHAILLDVQAANRNPDRFPGAERMDLTREPAGHLGFGTGIHFCLGAALARLEAAETLSRLFTRHPNLAPIGSSVRWRESRILHALQELPVRFET
ncbi:MAG TPA: cytochrome P450 [Sporichthyaceae bacterium]|jgi:hypothetical protein|nr:cytochrome P450 [Sporichthyaceae bacterium]